MPNSRLPVLVYRGAIKIDATSKAGDFDRMFEANGWRGIWRDGVYDYDHFHSNAHEVLGIAQGRATLQLGGASGKAIDVEAGDALVLPAGTGHRRISRSDNLVVIGAYPPGQENYDICRKRGPRRNCGSARCDCRRPIRCAAKAVHCSDCGRSIRPVTAGG